MTSRRERKSYGLSPVVSQLPRRWFEAAAAAATAIMLINSAKLAVLKNLRVNLPEIAVLLE
jgi:hypothetical protein